MFGYFVFALLPLFSAATQCGVGGLHRVVGGVTAIPNNWPWQITIQRVEKFTVFGQEYERTYHSCGGAIIAPEWILTAGHCFPRGTEDVHWRVVAGEHDLRSNSRLEQARKVIRVIMPSNYHGGPSQNDIALLRLDKPLEFGWGVQPICLPEQGDVDYDELNHCVLTGWGLTKGPQDSTKLQEVFGPTISPETCRDQLRHAFGNQVKDTMVCFGNGLKGGCMGDSGGPLACRVGGLWRSTGIVSFGSSKCLDEGMPTVFTQTSHYVDWIKSFIDKTEGEEEEEVEEEEEWK